MTALATPADVVARLGRALAANETARADGLLEEASDLVVGHLGFNPADRDGADLDLVARVVSRMVARVLEQSTAAGGVFGATSMTDQIGDFSQTRSFAQGTTTGGPWLSKADKVALRPLSEQTTPFAVDTAPGSGPWHTQTCSIVFGAAYCDCGSDLNAGQGPVFGEV
jgi:hypothetical protein